MPDPTRNGHYQNLIQRSPQQELDYLLCFSLKYLNKTESVKLTTAPIIAKIIVFTISSEFKLGVILKKVPLTVPTKVELLSACIVI